MNIQLTKNDFLCHHITDIPDPKAFHRHIHNEYEILFFVRGDADCIIEGSVYRLRDNDLLLIGPRTFHYINPRSQAIYERFVINFPDSMIPESVRDFMASAKHVYNLPKDSPLWDIPNLLLTPHVGGGMRLEITRTACVKMAMDNLERYLKKEPLANVVAVGK